MSLIKTTRDFWGQQNCRARTPSLFQVPTLNDENSHWAQMPTVHSDVKRFFLPDGAQTQISSLRDYRKVQRLSES